MKNTIYKFEELNNQELIDTNGGLWELLTLAAAIYGAGYACGQAYYYYTHP